MRWLMYLAVLAALVGVGVWAVSTLRQPRPVRPPEPPRPLPAPDWSPPSPGAPAGWYADPLGAHRARWWDGDSWTEQTTD